MLTNSNAWLVMHSYSENCNLGPMLNGEFEKHMKIENLIDNSTCYTSNVYLVLGDWNSLEDVNTLIDVGRDISVIRTIKNRRTGVGKKPIDQVILTHSHYDHVGILSEIRSVFNPVVLAYTSFREADRYIKNGEVIRIGDKMFEIIHTPGHSNDSICIYCEQDGVLFSGDTPLKIRTCDGTYQESYVRMLEYLAARNVKTIYSGHDPVVIGNASKLIQNSLVNVRKSVIANSH